VLGFAIFIPSIAKLQEPLFWASLSFFFETKDEANAFNPKDFIILCLATTFSLIFLSFKFLYPVEHYYHDFHFRFRPPPIL